jgi:hypothetical protein
MFLLRVGRFHRWEGSRDSRQPEEVAEAARDLQLAEGEVGLSVYRVEDQIDCREVAIRFAVTQRAKLQHLDYVVFPPNLAMDLGLTVEPVPRTGLDPYLNDRHHEIFGLTPELTLRLAEAILASDGRQVERIRRHDVVTLAGALYRLHPELRDYMKGSWAELLKGYLSDPPSQG